MAVSSEKLNQDKKQSDEFIRACERGDSETVRSFLEQDPSLANTADAHGKTPLMYAVKSTSKDKINEELFNLLLEHKADVNAVIHSGSERGITALWIAVAEARNNRLVQILLENGANDPDACPKAKGHHSQGKTVLYYAVGNNQDPKWTLVWTLLKMGAKNFDGGPEAEDHKDRGETVFWLVVQQACQSMSKEEENAWPLAYFLLEKGVTNLDTKPTQGAYLGMTPLLLAAANTKGYRHSKSWNFVKLLLDKGAKDLDASLGQCSKTPTNNPDNDDEIGTNALWWAAHAGRFDIVQLLANKGARGCHASPKQGEHQGKTVFLLLAPEENPPQWDLIRHFLKVGAKNLDAVSQEFDLEGRGLTLLWYAARDNIGDVLSDLLNKGVKNLDAHCLGEGEQYQTALWYTIENQNDSSFRLLLTKGASLQLVNNPKVNLRALNGLMAMKGGGRSPLTLTFDAAKALFHLAITTEELTDADQQYLKQCLTILGSALNGRMNGKTALQIAITKGNVSVTEALVLKGADLRFAEDRSEILLAEQLDKLQVPLRTELDKLLELKNKRRESKEEAEDEELQEPQESIEEKIKKLEEKINKISELKKLVQAFAKLQTLKAELDRLLAFNNEYRESKEEAEKKELKESIKEKTKKILELADTLLKQGQILTQPLHKDTFYYQLGDCLMEE